MSKEVTDRLDKMDGKLDEVQNNTHEIKTRFARLEVHVEKNTEDLNEHMKRTELNENRIYRLEKIEQWLRGATWITLGLGALVIAVVRLIN